MSTKLKEAQDRVIDLSMKSLAIAENHGGIYNSAGEQKKALDAIDPDLKKWQQEVEDLTYVENARKAFGAAGASLEDAGKGKDDVAGKSLGEQFVQSAGYKQLVEKGLKGGSWSSGEVELKEFFEGSAGTPGAGYAPATFAPNLVPGVVDQRFRPLTVAELFPSGTTNSPLIRYLVETVAENGAGGVAEGAPKPESNLQLDVEDETVKKIATFLTVTDEMLEDWAQTQSYINARLALFVRLEEELQLLRGDGTDDTLVGLLNREGLSPDIIRGTNPSAVDDNSMDAIYRQITHIRVTQFIEPDAIVIDPLGWEGIILGKDLNDQYYAGGPFLSDTDRTLWGKRATVSSAMDAKEALVGAFAQAAQVFRKGGLTVEASNSHADNFRRNKTSIRAEERLGLAVYRPGAFGSVTNLK